jgi:hypothetical protein
MINTVLSIVPTTILEASYLYFHKLLLVILYPGGGNGPDIGEMNERMKNFVRKISREETTLSTFQLSKRNCAIFCCITADSHVVGLLL